MSYVSYLLDNFGVNEDRILHRKPGFFAGVANHELIQNPPSAKAKTHGIKSFYDMEGHEASLADKKRTREIDARKGRVEKVIKKETRAAIRRQDKEATAEERRAKKAADREWYAKLKKETGVKVGRVGRDGNAGGKRHNPGSDVPTHDLMNPTMSQGAQTVMDNLGRGERGFDKHIPKSDRKRLSTDDAEKYGLIAKFRKDGKNVTGLNRQVFPDSYRDKPKFKGGRFAGDKDPDTGKELKAGDTYVAEALDVIIEAINQGYSDDDAYDIACQYLCENYDFGPWSSKRLLNEVLNEDSDENESA